MALLTELKIDRLSVDDRLQLVQDIWDSIAQSQAVMPLTTAQQTELEMRLRDHVANPDDVVDWDEIKSAALARVRKAKP